MCCRQITLLKIDKKLRISNPKVDCHNMNAYYKFGENQLYFQKLLSGNENTDVSQADNSVKN